MTVQRDGQDAIVSVELSSKLQASSARPPQLRVVPPGLEREDTIQPDFLWTDANRLEARFRMDRNGTYRTLLALSSDGATATEQQLLPGPAVALPYSPEFFPRRDLPTGKETLQTIAELSGGVSRTDIVSIFDDPPRSAKYISLLPHLFIIGICLVVIETAGRRLSLWSWRAGSQAEEDVALDPQRRRRVAAQMETPLAGERKRSSPTSKPPRPVRRRWHPDHANQPMPFSNRPRIAPGDGCATSALDREGGARHSDRADTSDTPSLLYCRE